VHIQVEFKRQNGRCSGNFRGTAVTDKDVSVVYVNIYRIADAKIVDNWYLSDGLHLAEQLGMKLIPTETGK
jgi:predicted ester cyclase